MFARDGWTFFSSTQQLFGEGAGFKRDFVALIDF
jgi:hypothetical protein